MVSGEFSFEPVALLHGQRVLQCIPSEWKQKMHRGTLSLDSGQLYRESIQISLGSNAVPLLDTSTKSIYRSLVQSKQYLTVKFDIPGDADIWKKIYFLPRKVTLDSKMRTFQCKILNNMLYLNHQMFHMKIV